MNFKWIRFLLIFIIMLLFLLGLSVGKANIGINEVLQTLVGNQSDELIQNLIINYRLPKVITATLVGIALPLSGLLLQELFRNPLAGPSVLGITSASGLGVAIVVFLVIQFGSLQLAHNPWVIIIAAIAGALIALLLLGIFAQKINSTTTLIVIGFMIAGFASAIIGAMQYFAPSEQIKTYLIWSFGSISGLSWIQLSVFFISVLLGVLTSVFTIKGIAGIRLGEEYAHSMGINVKKTRILILVASAVLTASSTAFTGPIAFIGLAIPHICRSYLKTIKINQLFQTVLLVGIASMLLFTLIAELFPFGTLPINIITSLIGAPIVISIIINKKYNNIG